MRTKASDSEYRFIATKGAVVTTSHYPNAMALERECVSAQMELLDQITLLASTPSHVSYLSRAQDASDQYMYERYLRTQPSASSAV